MGVSSPTRPSFTMPSPSLPSSTSQPSSEHTGLTPTSSQLSGPPRSPYVPSATANFELLNSWLALYGQEEINVQKLKKKQISCFGTVEQN